MGADRTQRRHLRAVQATDTDAEATELLRLWQESGLESTGTDPSIENEEKP